MTTNKKVTREIPYNHREDAEWLTLEICEEYRKKAERLGSSNSNNVGPRYELQMELQQRCDISELQALNIINGFHALDYVVHYERMRSHVTIEVVDPEYLEWLALKETEEQYRFLGDFGIEERD